MKMTIKAALLPPHSKKVLKAGFFYDTKTTSNKSKNKQVGLHQTKKPLHSKENNQRNEKPTYRMRENI